MANDEFDVTHLSPVPRNMNTQETRTLNLSPVIEKNAIYESGFHNFKYRWPEWRAQKKGRGGEEETQLSPQSPSPNFSPFPSPFGACHKVPIREFCAFQEYGVKQILSEASETNEENCW